MSRRSPVATFALLALAVLPTACTSMGATNREAPELAALRGMGYRIAVMPFGNDAPADGFLGEALAPVGELLALEPGRMAPMRDRVAAQLRRDVIAWLQQTTFEVVDPWFADTRLTHAGFTADALRDPANAAAIARTLECDGVVFGDVTRWNRSYYVVQSTAEVALHLELRDGTSGKSLFASERSETVGSGLTGGPTGYVSAFTEPLAGLRGSNLQALLRSVARHVATDLNGGELGAVLGPTSPRLAVVAIAQEHAGPFHAGDCVEVVAIGTPDCDVRFGIGRLRIDVPMQATARHPDARGERATYRGHYVVQPGDLAADLPLVCTIERGMARQQVAYHFAWTGRIALDGSPQ